MAQRTKTKARSSSRKKASTRSTARRGTAAKRAAAGRKGGRARTARRRSIPPAISKAAREMSRMVEARPAPKDAIALLEQDHREVEAMFEQFEQLDSKAEKAALAARICLALTVHATIEEELLYPPAHDEIEEDLVDEAIVEHNGAKQLIAEIEAMKPGEHLYDAKVKVLGEYVKHHVKEEENEMFPQLRSSDIDLQELGEQLMQRKVELLGEMAGKA
jgi:hemerythrin-like domain-containing protein